MPDRDPTDPQPASHRPSLPADLRHRIVRDREVVAALASRAGAGPVFAADLAAAVGLPENEMAVRLASLVSLGLVEQLMTGKDGGYTLTDLGRAQLQRPDPHAVP
jgi:DNA-binding IclR family transcriptional regulator